MIRFYNKVGAFITATITVTILGFDSTIRGIGKFTREKPGQILAPIGVLICTALSLTVADDTIFKPILIIVQFALIIIQFRSIRHTIKKNKKNSTEHDKERLQSFFDQASPLGIPGSIQFLSPIKERWPVALYYKIKGITRLTLYQFGRDDIWGSYTKIPVTKKQLFHLRLKDCIATEEPQAAVDGLTYIRDQQLTQKARDAIINVQYNKET